MSIQVVNFAEKFARIKGLHEYKLIAEMNDYHFKLVKMKREFVWHSHPETDEVFIVIDGKMKIELPEETLYLKKGEMVVIPKGIEHKPASYEECKILLIEPAGTINTGTAGGELTDTKLEWI